MAELTGRAGCFPGGTSAVFSTSPLPIEVGTRAFDKSGNEYIFVSFGGPVSTGSWVVISDLNVATFLDDVSVGRVGIVMGTTPTSNDSGWVQIYGLNIIAQSNVVSDESSVIIGLRATSVASTPLGVINGFAAVSTAGNIVHNAWMTALTPAEAGISGASDSSWPTTYTTAASSPTGSQHSGAVLGVFLNYPHADGQDVDRFGTSSLITS